MKEVLKDKKSDIVPSIGSKVGNLINLGQQPIMSGVDLRKLPYVENIFNNFNEFITEENYLFDIENFILNTKETKLDTIEIKQKNKSSEKYLVYFLGRGAIIEGEYKNMLHLSDKLDVNVLGFNYRGIGSSEGAAKNYKDLAADGVNEVKYLLQKGVKPENIMLYGSCMGAAIATTTAKSLHDKGIKVYLFNDRSYGKLTDFIVGAVHENYYQKDKKIMGKFLSALAYPFIKGTLKFSGWEMNAIKDYKQINPNFKDYLVVKASKEEHNKNNMYDDGLIENHASLHSALKKERRQEKNKIRKTIEDLQNGKIKTLSQSEKSRLLEVENKKLLEFKERKMNGSINNKSESVFNLIKNSEQDKVGHYKLLSELKNRTGTLTGEQYLKRFVDQKVGRDIKLI